MPGVKLTCFVVEAQQNQGDQEFGHDGMRCHAQT